jgi:two-component system sensor histidine kinase KdpD
MTWHLPARWPRYFQTWIKPFAAATIIISLAALTAPVLQRLPHANLSLLFMTGVLIVAVRFGLWPSIYASILSFLLYNQGFIDRERGGGDENGITVGR